MFHEKPISPQTLEKNFKDFAVGTLEPEVRTLLKQKKVTPEQYVYWASEHFKFQTFLAGLGLTVIFALIFFKIALDMGVEKGEAAFWWVLGMGGFFVFTFLILALSLRKNLPTHTGLYHDARGFYGLGLLRFTSLKYVQNRSEETWQKIREVKIPTFSSDSSEPHPGLESFKAKCRKAGFIGLAGFTLMVLTIFGFSYLEISLSGFVRSLFNSIFGLFYGLILAGFNGQLLTHCLLGFFQKDLIVWGRWGSGRYTGLMARYFSILGMLIALFLFGVGLLPVYFIVQASYG